MGYTVWDNMWGFGHHCGEKEKEEADDERRFECVCRVVEAEEDDRKDRRKHGCGCPRCRRCHGCHR
ncbi:hypothetical protein HUG15_15345 [Salicibibacter cibarius]|uniref:Uncharacterized protein n=1 Tax=Salicibibacter cibarius TaxID=2743000 RepID=A0A7T6Z4F4_9BACI|nr:hypothetical protein [Salicibibacter cibarius]QQK76800.1 hypothetical protein HUG15_15345 [Salicibibacter cibarius]